MASVSFHGETDHITLGLKSPSISFYKRGKSTQLWNHMLGDNFE